MEKRLIDGSQGYLRLSAWLVFLGQLAPDLTLYRIKRFASSENYFLLISERDDCAPCRKRNITRARANSYSQYAHTYTNKKGPSGEYDMI